jgi:hypothetical protein
MVHWFASADPGMATSNENSPAKRSMHGPTSDGRTVGREFENRLNAMIKIVTEPAARTTRPVTSR